MCVLQGLYPRVLKRVDQSRKPLRRLFSAHATRDVPNGGKGSQKRHRRRAMGFKPPMKTGLKVRNRVGINQEITPVLPPF